MDNDNKNTIEPGAVETIRAENIPALSTVNVPSNLLLVALACSGWSKRRWYLGGVFVHRTKDRGRVVGTDGRRMFVGEFGLPDDAPAWLEGGVIIPNSFLKAQLGLICKEADAAVTVKIGYAAGSPKVEIGDLNGNTVFRVPPVDGTYQYLKAAGEIARTMVLTAVNANAAAAGLLSYQGAANTRLYLLPYRAEEELGQAPVAFLSPAIEATLSEIRAHETGNKKDAKKARTTGERETLQERADAFAARIAAVIERTNPPALPKPDDIPAAAPVGATIRHHRAKGNSALPPHAYA